MTIWIAVVHKIDDSVVECIDEVFLTVRPRVVLRSGQCGEVVEDIRSMPDSRGC